MASTNYKAANYWLSSIKNCQLYYWNQYRNYKPGWLLCTALSRNYLMFQIFRFATKESAAHAIVATHNTEVAGHTVKCSWGKESGDPNNIHTNAQVAMQVSKK